MSKVTYNGWTNYSTWAVHIAATKDKNSIKYWKEIMEGIFLQKKPVSVSDAQNQLSKILQDTFEIYAESHLKMSQMKSTVWENLIFSSLGSVNWSEIAKHFIEQYQENNL